MRVWCLFIIVLLAAPGCTTSYLARHNRLSSTEWLVKDIKREYSKYPERLWAADNEDTIVIFHKTLPPMCKLPPFSNEPLPIFTRWRLGLDLDVLTIPIKFRPGLQGVPPALSAYFSGAIYLGYRFDYEQIKYKREWLGKYRRSTKPFAVSGGVMAGLSQARIDNTNTRGLAGALEYEGVAVMQGVAVVVSVGKVNFGASLGFDYLVDDNRRIWAHQMKPWVGLVIGLNLN